MRDEKVALVLSGDGANGAYQAAVLHALYTAGIEPRIVSGVSVGALNAVKYAMAKPRGGARALVELWKGITDKKQVISGGLGFRGLLRLVRPVKRWLGVHDTRPLRKLIEREVDASWIRNDIHVTIGVTLLESGNYITRHMGARWDIRLGDVIPWLLASASIPIAFRPVGPESLRVGDHGIDGGVRNMSPIGDVMHHRPDRVIIIKGGSFKQRVPPPTSVLDVAHRTQQIMTHEILLGDAARVEAVNAFIRHARVSGISEGLPRKSDGSEYREVIVDRIFASKALPSSLDFSKDAMQRRLDVGYEDADRYLSTRS